MIKTLIATALQATDVYMTLSAGGLEAEGNPFAIAIWSQFGLILILFIKAMAVFTFVMIYGYFGRFNTRPRRFLRLILCGYFYSMGSWRLSQSSTIKSYDDLIYE